ncbi:29 kDa ribonucleoprotein, putative [Entamoeba invadens IP1]|uniref:29 kDa ribonucleoprotein, putative n=1 Tax=Entamoeba invadens IP1 TaxID=370355 RepID=UPI0002C3E6A8|nr:29 kDa ribonucleoprotein, putative [Entamoeba invadens IP1]ELP93369.1 29 kDa ribonucleoprotein, putative [Entamoeba invadens IP1]|eukprot:XP_004260140.1 29 kDa ribonucleoprotein, putative [Entamoeba invadens IP1]
MTKLYVGNLSFKTTEEAMKTHFESFGKVKECRLMIYRGYSKGFGFVEYETEEDAKKAVASTGAEFDGRKVRVEVARPPVDRSQRQPRQPRAPRQPREAAPRAEGEKAEAQAQEGSTQPRGYRRFNNERRPVYNRRRRNEAPKSEEKQEFSETLVFVGNLAFAATDDDLKKTFEKFNVVSAKVVTFGRTYVKSKGFGFVELKTKEDQQNAIKELNQSTQMERKITVSPAFKKQEKKAEEVAAPAKDVKA